MGRDEFNRKLHCNRVKELFALEKSVRYELIRGSRGNRSNNNYDGDFNCKEIIFKCPLMFPFNRNEYFYGSVAGNWFKLWDLLVNILIITYFVNIQYFHFYIILIEKLF